MFLKQIKDKQSGKTYLKMARTYRVKGKKHPQTEIVDSFGILEDLQALYDDPIAHFKEVVAQRNIEEKLLNSEYTISASKNQLLELNTDNRRNYGYIIIMKLFHELGLPGFLHNRQRRNSKIECNTSSIMKLLVISRILTPGSKKKAYEARSRYFDFETEHAFELVDIYRCLSFFATLEKDIQLLMHKRITANYGRKLDMIYYDVTNYYFEIDMEDDLQKKGVSKERRPNPIVQMGLATDAEGIPLSYEIFPGNKSEKLQLRPAVFELYSKYDSERVIAVADSAQNTGNNIYYLDDGNQGYVFSQSIRGSSAAFKQWVADDSDYEWYGQEYKRKSRVERREIQVDFEKAGKTHKKKVYVDQRQIVFYSEKYAVRAKAKRKAALLKAARIIENPSAYTRAASYGAMKYVMNIEFDKNTGEVKPSKSVPCLDFEAIAEEEKYDGYYAIVTNLFDEGKNKGKYADGQIIDIYRGLWRVEDSFRITKSELDARPVYLSRKDRIKAHFLTCFISLVIVRLIQKATNHAYSPEKLIEAMNQISCAHEGGNLYLFNYRSDISDALGAAFGIDFTKLRLTRSEIKKNIADVKNT